MTEKRFYIAESNLIDGYCVFDREKKYTFSPKPRWADCLNDVHILNELAEENMMLKDENIYYKSVLMALEEMAKHISNIPRAKNDKKN